MVCYSGDGSAMYSIQALWTAAHHKLPLTVVLINNGGYRIIKQRLLAFTATTISSAWISPIPGGFHRLARSLGLEAIASPSPRFLPALHSAFSRPGAKLIEVVVDGTV